MTRRALHSIGMGGIGILLSLGGCMTVGPDYAPPHVVTPDAWQQAIASQMSDGAQATLATWWAIFDDPILDGLIERARAENLDLQVATARVAAARDQLAMTHGEQSPAVDASGSAGRTKQSDDGVLQQVAPANGFDAQNLYTLEFDASWELDIFGKIRRSIEAADAQYQATVEMQRDVLVTLLAEVALAYVDYRELGQRIVITEENVAAQREVLALADDRYRAGLTSKLDVVQAQALLGTTLAVMPSLVIAQQRALNRLAVLLGQNAGSLQIQSQQGRPIPAAGALLASGVPADILRQRPDVRAAERELAAQTAAIGVATAALYPDFTLTGFFGQQSRSVADLAVSGGNTWGVSLPLQWSVFDGGIIRSNIRIQEQLARQALLNYRQSVLVAIEEVENALLGINQSAIRTTALNGAVTAIAEAVRLVTVQYNTGLTEFNNVLVTERSLFELQDSQARNEAQSARDMIALYKALGGGWTAP